MTVYSNSLTYRSNRLLKPCQSPPKQGASRYHAQNMQTTRNMRHAFANISLAGGSRSAMYSLVKDVVSCLYSSVTRRSSTYRGRGGTHLLMLLQPFRLSHTRRSLYLVHLHGDTTCPVQCLEVLYIQQVESSRWNWWSSRHRQCRYLRLETCHDVFHRSLEEDAP